MKIAVRIEADEAARISDALQEALSSYLTPTTRASLSRLHLLCLMATGTDDTSVTRTLFNGRAAKEHAR